MSQFVEWKEHQGCILDALNEFEIIECQKCGFKHIVPTANLKN